MSRIPDSQRAINVKLKSATEACESPVAPCQCPTFQDQYIPPSLQSEAECDRSSSPMRYARLLDDTQAATSLRTLVTQMIADQSYLRVTLAKYGDAFLQWWDGRRQTGRRSLLDQTVPDLAESQKSQVDGLLALSTSRQTGAASRKGSKSASKSSVDIEQRCLLLYLDRQTLARDTSHLLAIMSNRATTPIEEWVAFDDDQLATGWTRGIFRVDFHAGCVLTSGPDYG